MLRDGLGERDSLTPDDTVRFDTLMVMMIGSFIAMNADRALLGQSGSATGERENIRAFLSTPGGASWWASYQARFSPEVREDVSSLIERPRPPAA